MGSSVFIVIIGCIIKLPAAMMVSPRAGSLTESFSHLGSMLNSEQMPVNYSNDVQSTKSIRDISSKEVTKHEMDLMNLRDIVQDVLRSNPQAKPEKLAKLLQTHAKGKDVFRNLERAALEIGKVGASATKNTSKEEAPLDSGLVGVAVGVSGKGSGTTGVAFTVVAFVNVGTAGQPTRICIGTRGGISGPNPGEDKDEVNWGIVAGPYNYKYVPGSAFFVGGSAGSLTTLASTLATKPDLFIGLVFVVGNLGKPFEVTGTGNAEFIMGETWCWPISG